MNPSDFVVEPLALGFFCRACGAFNGDAREFRFVCRACDADRPRLPELPPFTHREQLAPDVVLLTAPGRNVKKPCLWCGSTTVVAEGTDIVRCAVCRATSGP